MADTERLQWRKSARCDSSSCVEVAQIDGGIALRDGKDPGGPRLIFTARQWTSFLAWARQRTE
ncbi:DUF397 domain-containing protein [Phytohabitans sp. ZYX-F-186]|uniref:DUF397 domain-containing protein n=1 Tax=Phytohabitans maris TaxID=3071409 RepID=A0ABU0ZL95_9ACTN|nr:DUF397 domain-containing protein [Phytohabitans sp. ZYX-F-186]MDQ7907356.1 DUF397 domain-containing protein [Phytohabitans sp. ZYX-F-186]